MPKAFIHHPDMKKTSKHRKPDRGRISGAVIFIVLILSFNALTARYDPETGSRNNFFEDVSDAIPWR